MIQVRTETLRKIDMLQAIIFDLDDTLFEEGDFVISGFRAVAKKIAESAGAATEDVFQFLLKEYRENGRGKIFNVAFRQYGISDSQDQVESFVQLYRRHLADISLYPGVESLLMRLKNNYRLAIVTDGAVEMQSNKIRALGLHQLVDHVVYCWNIGYPKPDPKGCSAAIEHFDILPSQAMVIGDHPLNDIYVGKRIGTLTARVRTGRFSEMSNLENAIPDFDLKNVVNITSVLNIVPDEK
jgi:putative hydrolase of the HAD superfamily